MTPPSSMLHSVHADVRPQIEALSLESGRPLIITDADEVLFLFVQGLQRYLLDNGFELRLDSFALTGNIRERKTQEVVPAPDVRRLIGDFFERHTEDLDPVDGAAEALAEISTWAQVIVLSNVPLAQREARTRALQRHGMDYPLIANVGTKGHAVATLCHAVDAPTIFIDDIPHNITSVAETASQVVRLHFIADPQLARLLDKAPDADARIDDWPAAHRYIEQQLSGPGQ